MVAIAPLLLLLVTLVCASTDRIPLLDNYHKEPSKSLTFTIDLAARRYAREHSSGHFDSAHVRSRLFVAFYEQALRMFFPGCTIKLPSGRQREVEAYKIGQFGARYGFLSSYEAPVFWVELSPVRKPAPRFLLASFINSHLASTSELFHACRRVSDSMLGNAEQLVIPNLFSVRPERLFLCFFVYAARMARQIKELDRYVALVSTSLSSYLDRLTFKKYSYADNFDHAAVAPLFTPYQPSQPLAILAKQASASTGCIPLPMIITDQRKHGMIIRHLESERTIYWVHFSGIKVDRIVLLSSHVASFKNAEQVLTHCFSDLMEDTKFFASIF